MRLVSVATRYCSRTSYIDFVRVTSILANSIYIYIGLYYILSMLFELRYIIIYCYSQVLLSKEKRRHVELQSMSVNVHCVMYI